MPSSPILKCLPMSNTFTHRHCHLYVNSLPPLVQLTVHKLQRLLSIHAAIALMHAPIVPIRAVRIRLVTVRLDQAGVLAACLAAGARIELCVSMASQHSFLPNREVACWGVHTPGEFDVPLLYDAPGVWRGLPIQIVALTWDPTALEIGAAVSWMPMLGSPPPHMASSMIWAPFRGSVSGFPWPCMC